MLRVVAMGEHNILAISSIIAILMACVTNKVLHRCVLMGKGKLHDQQAQQSCHVFPFRLWT
jgi:Na+/citrate or Na+/malate symporter